MTRDTAQHAARPSTDEWRDLGAEIRRGREAAGLSITELAERLGRQRSWLSKLEAGNASVKIPDDSLLDSIGRVLDPHIDLARLRERREAAASATARFAGRRRRSSVRADVVDGEEAVMDAIVSLINDQGPEATLRNTGIKTEATYKAPSDTWKRYRSALKDFLARNEAAAVRRLEYVTDRDQLQLAREADEYLRPQHKLQVGTRVRFRRRNPLALQVLLGEREALIAFPYTAEQRPRLALVIRDQHIVRGLLRWYDLMWDCNGDEEGTDFVQINFSDLDGSYRRVEKMYGFADAE